LVAGGWIIIKRLREEIIVYFWAANPDRKETRVVYQRAFSEVKWMPGGRAGILLAGERRQCRLLGINSTDRQPGTAGGFERCGVEASWLNSGFTHWESPGICSPRPADLADEAGYVGRTSVALEDS
jgi:hypothetical protein